MSKVNNLKSQMYEISKEYEILEANYLKSHSMYTIKI